MSSIREIAFAMAIGVGGGGGDVSVESLNVSENGEYTAPSGKAYSPVNVNVPNTYTAADEGKVVDNGALVAQTSLTVTANGTVDTTVNDEVTVDVQPALQSKTVTQNGTVTPDQGYDGLSSVLVNVSGGGGGSVPPNDVNFRDYDGTIVNAYSAADFANLTAMPANPSHSGLTAQGWNWSLADAKAYVSKYCRLEIGQMYITDDGKTRVYIHLEQDRMSPMLGCCPNGTVDVDWGDGTAHDTLTGTSTSTVQWTPNHAYAAPGNYVIKLTVTGEMGLCGDGLDTASGLIRYSVAGSIQNQVYSKSVQKIEIGNSVGVIGAYEFNTMYNLDSISIPESINNIGEKAFCDCRMIRNVNIPNGTASIPAYAFQTCYSLTSVSIPKSVTGIGNYAFNNSYNLLSINIPENTILGTNVFNGSSLSRTVVIPDGVTSIGNSDFKGCFTLHYFISDSVASIDSNAFQKCYYVVAYHFSGENPPTLSATSAFSGIPADCIIYVPYSADHSILEAYKTASNWSTYASYMREELA